MHTLVYLFLLFMSLNANFKSHKQQLEIMYPLK